MSILDSIRKNLQKGEKKSESPVDRTIEQILSNEQESALFGNMLLSSGRPEDQDLAERIDRRDLEPDHLKLLNERRAEFVEKLRAVEDVKKMLSPDFMGAVKKIAGEDSDFAQMIGSNGGNEKASELFRKQIMDLAINHPDHFDRIAEAVKTRREHHKATDERVKKVVQKYGFSTNKYAEIMGTSDSVARYDKFREEIKKNLRGLGAFMDKITLGGYSKVKTDLAITREESSVNAAHAQDSGFLENIGGVLAGVVADNDEMRSIFSHALVGEIKELQRGESFKLLGAINQAGLVEAWKKDGRPPDFHRLPNPAKRHARRTFVQSWQDTLEARLTSATGVWAPLALAKLTAFDPVNNANYDELV